MIENVLENRWNEIIKEKYEAYFQPQYDNFSYEITGFEALARLNDPDGLVSPASFIGVLERNRMIVKLDTFVFESACKFIKKCEENNTKVVPISVNLSRNDFYEENFIDVLNNIVKKYEIDSKLIGIEITDALSLENKSYAEEIVKKFHKYGFFVVLDNFDGRDKTLTSVVDIRYDAIKLNMGKLSNDFKNGGSLISSIIDRANKLDVSIMAERVETREEIEFLKTKNCKYAQGYYYAKPMSENDAYIQLKQSEEDPVVAQMQQKLVEAEAYQKKFETILEQLDIYFWEYIVATKEMHPCIRSMRAFGLAPIIYNCPKSFIESGAIPDEYVQMYKDVYTQIDNGAKHVEVIVPMAENRIPYIVRCDTEFDEFGKPVRAYCSAIKAYNDK